jgi:FixJ family two-component response regulator
MGPVYVIEPDVAIQDALKTLLASVNVAVTGYPDALVFLNAVGAVSHGCILVEAEMPRLNGLGLLNSLRKHGSEASVLLLVDDADPEFVKRALAAGAQAVIQKPLTDEDLIAVVQASFDEAGSRHTGRALRHTLSVASARSRGAK